VPGIPVVSGRPGPPRRVRDATPQDAAACASVYAPYVTGTAITFESVPPTVGEMAERIADAQRTHAWLVLEQDDEVVGYAYGGAFRPRAAYRWSCEVSVYLALDRRGAGGGTALYDALLVRLAARGFRTAVATLTLPNEPSARLHRSLGFEPAGSFRRIGWKAGSWHDVAWMQRDLAPADEPSTLDPPPEPR
jgi:L-amino acid N-acyltransferase YncA